MNRLATYFENQFNTIGSPNAVPGPVAPASLWNLLEKEIVKPHHKHAETETLGGIQKLPSR